MVRKRVSFIVDKPYLKNGIFDEAEPSRVKYSALKKAFEEAGFEIGTQDVVAPECSDILIFLDRLPSARQQKIPAKKYLIAMESPIIKPLIFSRRNHSQFSIVFTWNDDWVDGVKYFKIGYALDMRHKIVPDYESRSLSSMVFSNRLSRSENELYSFRRKIIRWFELNYPDDFHLYGRAWDVRRSNFKILNAILGLQLFGFSLGKLIGNGLATYRGEVADKYAVIAGYKFVFCPENVSGWNGYVTEKIIDAICVGAVPIYTGAPNISKFVPDTMFLTFNEGDSFESLYFKLLSYTERDFLEHKKLCEEFVVGMGRSQFGIEQFVDSIFNPILSDVGV